MRNALFVILCCFIFALVLAACNDKGAPADSSGNGELTGTLHEAGDDFGGEVEQITISVYYPPADDPAGRELEDDKIRRFQEAYPHVTVEGHSWHYSPDEIGIRMAGHDAPTLFNTYATEGRFLVERGWAADITEFWNNWEYNDQMNPVLQDQFIIDGRVYGIAQQGYVTAVVVNKKMLEEKGIELPPFDWTWDDFYEVAAAATDPDQGISGVALMGQGNEAGWIWTSFFFSAGGEIQQVEDGRVTAIFDSQPALDALDLYHRLRWDANAIPVDWALDWGGAVGSFAQGRAAMVLAGPDGPVDQALNQRRNERGRYFGVPDAGGAERGSHRGAGRRLFDRQSERLPG